MAKLVSAGQGFLRVEVGEEGPSKSRPSKVGILRGFLAGRLSSEVEIDVTEEETEESCELLAPEVTASAAVASAEYLRPREE